MKNNFDSIDAKQKKISEITWDITADCNLSCRHCYIEPHNSGMLTPMQEQRVVREAAELGAEKIILSGGEPFTKKNLQQVADEIKSYSMGIGIISNGTMIDFGLIGRAEPEFVQVSIDGKKDFHDWLRGESYDSAVAALKKLAEFDTQVSVSTTLMKGNYRQAGEILDRTHDYIDGYRGNLLVPVGRAAATREMREQALSPNEVIDAVRIFSELQPLYPEISFSFPREYVAQLALLTGEIRENVFMQHKQSCSAFDTIGIAPNGNVLPCIYLQNNVIGSIKEKTLHEIMQAIQNPKLSREGLKRCDCRYAAVCEPCSARVLDGSDMYCIKSLPSIEYQGFVR
jgi:radical SAM protein with 4Fe4S-binding SPASM domain